MGASFDRRVTSGIRPEAPGIVSPGRPIGFGIPALSTLLSNLLSDDQEATDVKHEIANRASDCDSEGYGFDPRRPPHFIRVP